MLRLSTTIPKGYESITEKVVFRNGFVIWTVDNCLLKLAGGVLTSEFFAVIRNQSVQFIENVDVEFTEILFFESVEQFEFPGRVEYVQEHRHIFGFADVM